MNRQDKIKSLRENVNENRSKLNGLVDEYDKNKDPQVGTMAKQLRSVVEAQDQELRSLEDQENSVKKEQNKLKKENRTMDKAKAKEEIRTLSEKVAGMMLRDGADVQKTDEFKEYRDASITLGNDVHGSDGNGGVTVPHTVAENVIELAGRTAPIVDQVNRLTPINGTIDVLRETKLGTAGWTDELSDLASITSNFEEVTLTQKRLGAYIQLTEQLINDSGIDIYNYSINYLSRSIAKALEKAILVGENSPKKMSSIESQADADHSYNITPANVTYDKLIDLYTGINPAYLSGASMVMSTEMFQKVAKLQDGDGEYLILKSAVAGEAGYRLFGTIPVYVSDALDNSKTNIVFGNFQLGYTMMIKEGMNLKHVTADSRQVLAGGHLIALDMYLDGAVTDPNAFLIANGTGKDTTTPQADLKPKDGQQGK